MEDAYEKRRRRDDSSYYGDADDLASHHCQRSFRMDGTPSIHRYEKLQ
jgi:hypothetical protein